MEYKYLEKAAEDLRKASVMIQAIAPLTEQYPGITLEEAYKVQLINVEAEEKKGAKIVGKKIGLTSKAMQNFLNVNEPDYGHIYDYMVWDEENPIETKKLLQPKIEAEIAFVLGEDLCGPGITIIDVLRATVGVIPAFEVIDSRIKDWKIELADTIADNASIGGVVLGAKLIPANLTNLKYVGLVLDKNGNIMETAAGAAVMGHPALAVAWLANKVATFGIGLKKGEIILSGSLTKAIEVKAGDVFNATFGELGSVKVVFA